MPEDIAQRIIIANQRIEASPCGCIGQKPTRRSDCRFRRDSAFQSADLGAKFRKSKNRKSKIDDSRCSGTKGPHQYVVLLAGVLTPGWPYWSSQLPMWSTN